MQKDRGKNVISDTTWVWKGKESSRIAGPGAGPICCRLLEEKRSSTGAQISVLVAIYIHPDCPVPALTVSFPHSKQRNATYSVQSSHLPTQSSQSAVQYNPPVKLDFPTFSSTQEDDPVVFIEHCEEYFAVRPLSDGEILASLTAVLKGTAKDWWMAENEEMCTIGDSLKRVFCTLF